MVYEVGAGRGEKEKLTRWGTRHLIRMTRRHYTGSPVEMIYPRSSRRPLTKQYLSGFVPDTCS